MIQFLISIINKFQNAINGFFVVLKEEKTILIQIIFDIFVITLGIILHLKNIEWALVSIVIFSIFTLELLNTALENFLDFLDFNYNSSIKKIKDIFAAASLFLSIGAVAAILFIYIPELQTFIHNHK